MSLLADRYASKAMREIWSLHSKYVLERELWILVMKAQSKAGFPIPESTISDYERVKNSIDVESMNKREAILRHDVKARIEEFNALAGHESIHLGLTSRDVTDNVELSQIRDSLRLVLRKSEALLLRLASISEKYAELPMVGRTHNVPAQVTTLGKRFATWAEELLFSTQHCEELLERLPLRGIKGAIGTALDQNELLGVAGNQIEGELISAWGFDSALTSTSQVYPRSIDFEVVSTIAQLAAAPSTLATNIRLMSGFGLLSEGFGKGQVGSSAMPHKVNPRLSERINSLAVILKGFVTMAAEISGEQWNEGDVSCSAVRRVVLPDSFCAIDAILETTISVVDSLEIFENEIKAELHRHLPLMLSTKILMLAVKNGVGRERAHELIKGYARNTDRNQFIAAVTSDSELKLDDLELKEILDKPLDLAGSASQQAREVTKSIRAKTFSRDSSIYNPDLKN